MSRRKCKRKWYPKTLNRQGGFGAAQVSAVKKVDFPLEVDAQALGLREGKATIVVTVRDLSWKNWFKGRATTLKKEMVIYYKQSP